MLIKAHCQHCGEFFMPDRITGQYCSSKCRTAAWRKRQKSPFFKAVKAIAKAKTKAAPSMKTCPMCKVSNLVITDGYFGLCQNGHLWSFDGLYHGSGTGTEKELFDILNRRLLSQVKGT